jgi:hypothetical protein
MRSQTEFWRKHPALELAFTAIFTAGWFAGILVIIANGKFKFGRGANAVPITPANDPAAFWGIVGVLVILGIAAPAYNVPRIVRRLNEARSPEDSDSGTKY